MYLYNPYAKTSTEKETGNVGNRSNEYRNNYDKPNVPTHDSDTVPNPIDQNKKPIR